MQISGLRSNASQPSSPIFKGNSVLRSVKDSMAVLKAQERERQLQESENELIEKLKERMIKIGESDLNDKVKQAKIDNITQQIQQIYENRTEREQLAAEREMEKRRQKQEEKAREQEKANEKMNVNNQNITKEEAVIREDISGMVKLAISHGGINALKKTQALREAEANRLENEFENDTGLQQIGLDLTIKTKVSPSDFPNSFRARTLAKLNEGISNMEAGINREMGKINNTLEDWAEDRNDTVQRADDETTVKDKKNGSEKEKDDGKETIDALISQNEIQTQAIEEMKKRIAEDIED